MGIQKLGTTRFATKEPDGPVFLTRHRRRAIDGHSANGIDGSFFGTVLIRNCGNWFVVENV